ncbi:flippase [ANME-1 cluster archaeon AG-394-G21]|nr:flippase [ANME-1 cluster archaeon AG-394-G21]
MLSRKSALIVAVDIFSGFVSWIGLLAIARLWGGFAPTAIGVIGFGMAFIGMFNVIADLGFSAAHVKRISEGKDLGDCIGTYATIKILLTGIMVALVIGGIATWKYAVHNEFFDDTRETVIYVFILYYIFSNLASIALQTFVGRKEIAKRGVSRVFEPLVRVPLMILVAFAGVTGIAMIAPELGIDVITPVTWPAFLSPIQIFIAAHAVGALAMCYAIGFGAVFLVAAWLLRKYPIKRYNKELAKNYLVFALPVMLLSITSVISLNVDKVMLGYFWTFKEVGYYFSVQRITILLLAIPMAVGTVLFPTISEYHAREDLKGIKEVTHSAERYISMVAIPLITFVIIFPAPIINIVLSSAFLPAASTLAMLTVYVFILSLTGPYSSLIKGINRPDIAAKIGVGICITNIGLNYFFIPEWGLLSPLGINGSVGAATATVLSQLVGFVGLRVAARRLTGIKLMQTNTPRHIVAGVVMGIVLYYLNSLVPLVRWHHLIGFALVGIAVYICVLFIIREFKKRDLKFFFDLAHPVEMLDYIKSELKGKTRK